MNYTDYHGFNLNDLALQAGNTGLSFRLARRFWSGEKRFHATQLTVGIVDDMMTCDKEQAPIVNFTSHPNFNAVVADFDVLPEGYADFEALYHDLKAQFPEACVMRSMSGKVKAVFLLEKKLHTDFTATLKELIGPTLYAYVDVSSTALTQTFINESMYSALKSWLKTPYPMEPVLKSFFEINCENLSEEYFRLSEALGDFLVYAGFTKTNFRCMTEERLMQLSVQLITSALKLSNEGAILNQEIFAKVLGLGSARTAARILTRLQDIGWLEMVKNYSAGNCSRVYVAAGPLLTFFKKNGLDGVKAATTGTPNVNNYINQLQAPNGSANDYYVKVTTSLLSKGLPLTATLKVLYDIDSRRAYNKRRPNQYFMRLVQWGARVCGGGDRKQ